LLHELTNYADQWNNDGHRSVTLYSNESLPINHSTNEEKWSEEQKSL